jgi:hypothetical protein
VQLVASVWDNILQLPAQNRDTAELDRPQAIDLPLLSAAVRLTGGWEELVALTASGSLAAKCTAIMHQRGTMACPWERCARGGELANIAGGNLSVLVPER